MPDIENFVASDMLKESVREGEETLTVKKERKYNSLSNRRKSLMTESERKELYRLKSRNYEQTIRDEIASYQSELETEQLVLDEKSRLVDDLSSTLFEHQIQSTWYMSESILNTIGVPFNREDVDNLFKIYMRKKELIPLDTFTAIDDGPYKKCEKYQIKLNDLIENKQKHVKEKRKKGSFSSAKQRLSKQLLRSTLKRDCYSSRIRLMNIEERIKNIQNLNDELKTVILSKIIQPIDEVIKKSRICEENEELFSIWQTIKKFYQNEPDSQILEDVQNEITPSTSSQTSELPAATTESEDLEDTFISDDFYQQMESLSGNEHEKCFLSFFR